MQPRYGFTLKLKPTSGLSLVARMAFVVSSQTWTAARGWSSSRYSSAVGENGFGGLDQARGFMAQDAVLERMFRSRLPLAMAKPAVVAPPPRGGLSGRVLARPRRRQHEAH